VVGCVLAESRYNALSLDGQAMTPGRAMEGPWPSRIVPRCAGHGFVVAGWTGDIPGQPTNANLTLSKDVTAIGQARQLKPD